MPARVELTVFEGPVKGKVLVLDEPGVCIVGRTPDCMLRIPERRGQNFVSRYHCLFDINPPQVTVRDFGSMNGTYVNGVKIGQRPPEASPEEGRRQRFLEHDLVHGDVVQLGDTAIRIGQVCAAYCDSCLDELLDAPEMPHLPVPSTRLCMKCRMRFLETGAAPRTNAGRSLCAHCGRDAGQEMGAYQPGEYLCSRCRARPTDLIETLLARAAEGGEQLGAIRDYAIEKELGRGGMGAAYLARHRATGRSVALKVLLPHAAFDAACKAYFLREIDNTRALRHPNVVRLYDHGASDGAFFFALQYCGGGDLECLLQKHGGQLPLDEAVPLMLQVLDGLAYAHQVEVNTVLQDGTAQTMRGIVHRDIKPSNIFLSQPSRHASVLVGDFGIGKAFDAAGLSGRTRTGQAAGTPAFMPRQQVINFKYARPDVDVWAAAATLYYLLTGALVRDYPAGRDPWCVVLRNRPVPIRRRDSRIPERLAKVMDEALEDSDGLAYQSAASFKRSLECAL